MDEKGKKPLALYGLIAWAVFGLIAALQGRGLAFIFALAGMGVFGWLHFRWMGLPPD